MTVSGGQTWSIKHKAHPERDVERYSGSKRLTDRTERTGLMWYVNLNSMRDNKRELTKGNTMTNGASDEQTNSDE